MKNLQGFLRLIRWPNLLYIILTQFLLCYALLIPVYSSVNFTTAALDWTSLCLLVLSTVLIAAGGYVINDYFDVKADEINRPDKIVVGRLIERRHSLIIHGILKSAGLATGFIVALRVGFPVLLAIQLGISSLLWLYSTLLKRLPLIGNIAVSFMTAAVILIVLVYETSFFDEFYAAFPSEGKFILYHFLGYALFAFLLTLIREIVKDLEDMEGDRSIDCKTIPLLWGIPVAKAFVVVFAVLVSALVASYLYYFVGGAGISSSIVLLKIAFLLLLVQLPLVLLIKWTLSADKPSHYHRISNLLKLTMLAGILFLLIIKYTIA
ncbi:geranylgeranylglycerol-phosphate geranylgeranyltransferase [Chitinophagales bacterium]|nr:geranylgeranylglycerol-phosphate geranylgeranyltransferase [Chitinophagales bacterium]